MKQLLWVLTLLGTGYLSAQIDIQKLVRYSDSISIAGISNSSVPGLVLSIASSDSIYLLKGYGYSNVEKKIPCDPKNTMFQVGSIGKLFTSIGLLQQVEEKKISLVDDVNKYLDGWQIRNPFDQKVTPRHLLSHSAGFNDHFLNYMARSNSEIESLGAHLKMNMPSVFIEPGSEINYSNYSYALAGHLIEQVADVGFEEQMQASIFKPLQMSSASYFLPDNYLDQDIYANGYQSRDTFVGVRMFPRHAKPAGSLVATAKDMMTFSQTLLSRDSVLLEDDSYNLLLDQQFTNHPKLSGYSLGMEVQDFNGQIAYAKGGQVNGFLSILVVFPDIDLAIFMSTNTQTDNHFSDFFLGLKNQFFPVSMPDPISIDFNMNDYSGVFASKRANHENIEELFQLYLGQFTIREAESGNLRSYHDNAWHEYQYLGDDVFQDISNSHNYIVFKRKYGKVKSMYRSVNIGGIEIPCSYRKLNWFERPRFLNDEYPFLLMVLFTYLLIPVFWVVRFFIRKKNPQFGVKWSVPMIYHGVAFLFFGLFIWNLIGLMVPIIKLKEDIAFGLPDALINMKYVNWAMVCSSLVLIYYAIQMWARKESTLVFKLYFTLYCLVAFSYILVLYRWHFLNVTV